VRKGGDFDKTIVSVPGASPASGTTDPSKMASEKRLRIKTLVMVLAMVVCAKRGRLDAEARMSQIGEVQLTASGSRKRFV